tara:strand:+ start:1311 stop:4403 length:3093 start_codon:yes stop_codon:yes gene_type:complete
MGLSKVSGSGIDTNVITPANLHSTFVLPHSKLATGAGSGLDADTLDNIQASSFLRSDQNDTLSGNLTVNRLFLGGSSNGGFDYNSIADTLEILTTNGSTHSEFNASAFVPASNGTKNLGANALRWGTVHANSVKIDGNTAWHAGNDGAGSGLDADTIDGYDSTNYLGKNGSAYYQANNWIDFGTSSGKGLYWSGGGATGWHIYPLDASNMRFRTSGTTCAIRFDTDSGTARGFVYANNSNEIGFLNNSGSWQLRVPASGSLMRSNSYYTIWDSGNDGSGSGLDADLLDGQNGSYYLDYNNLNNVPSGSGNADTVDNLHASSFLRSDADDVTGSGVKTRFGGVINSGSSATVQVDGFMRTCSIFIHQGGTGSATESNGVELTNTSGSLLWGGSTVWHSGNDGSGSGLDADALDGLGSGDFLRSNANDTYTGTLSISGSINNASTNGSSGAILGNLEVGYGAAYNSISARSNNSLHLNYNSSGTVYVGGSNTVWHAGNDGSGSGLDADTCDGQHLGTSAGVTFGNISFSGVGGNSGQGPHSYAIYQESGSWSSPFPDLVIAWHTGIKIGGHRNYNGTRFYNDSPGANSASAIFSVGDGDNNVRVYNNLYISGSQAWHDGNDGAGSGLDADTTDGLHVHSSTNNEANKIVRTNGSGYIMAGWINTSSGNNTSTTPDRFYGSHDGYIRYYDRAYTQMFLGNTFKYTTSRRQHTTDSNYWVGTMGWGTVDFNTLFHYGSGHFDTWSNPGNQPSGTSHWIGHQSLHYTNGSSSAYGHQFTVGAGNPALCYLRGRWGSSFTSWAKMWNDQNDGAGSGLDADTVDGIQGSDLMGKTGSYWNANNWLSFNSTHGLYWPNNYSYHVYLSSQYLRIRNNNNANGIQIVGNNSSLRGYLYADNNNHIGLLNNGGSWSLKCDSSGNVTATGNVTAYSDIRIKKNVRTIDNALDKVTSMRGVYFDRKDTGKASVGVIAQEIEPILPEVVETQDTRTAEAPDKLTDLKTVSYGNIVGVLIEAIKEQQEQINTLKDEIQTLKSRQN